MINQQLLDFIKQQLQTNVPKEKIIEELLVNGWSKEDVHEGFNNLNTPNINMIDKRAPIPEEKKRSGGKIFLIILLIILLGGGAGLYYFRDNLVNLSIVEKVINFKNKMLGQEEEMPIFISEISDVNVDDVSLEDESSTEILNVQKNTNQETIQDLLTCKSDALGDVSFSIKYPKELSCQEGKIMGNGGQSFLGFIDLETKLKQAQIYFGNDGDSNFWKTHSFVNIITSPRNGDVLKVGQTYEIKWTGAFSDIGIIKIILINEKKEGTSDFYTIGTVLDSQRSFKWSVPESLDFKKCISPTCGFKIALRGDGFEIKNNGYITFSDKNTSIKESNINNDFSLISSGQCFKYGFTAGGLNIYYCRRSDEYFFYIIKETKNVGIYLTDFVPGGGQNPKGFRSIYPDIKSIILE